MVIRCVMYQVVLLSAWSVSFPEGNACVCFTFRYYSQATDHSYSLRNDVTVYFYMAIAIA